jgi:proteasome assembly chaperone (PAC2) family protein
VELPLRFQVEPGLTDPVLVLAFRGWNDAGEAASAALRFLSESIRAVPLADLDPEEFFDFTVARPEIVYDGGETRGVKWPVTEFEFGSLDDSRQVVLGIGVEPHLRWRSFCECLVELTRRTGVKRVALLGAYLADVVYSRPVALTGFASDPSVLEQLGVERSNYQGPTGIVGVLAERLQREGLEVLSLWAGLPHYLNASPNPRGSLALLEKLCRYLDCKIDEGAMKQEAVEFELRISKLVDKDPELREYVRQLKKRDFAQ